MQRKHLRQITFDLDEPGIPEGGGMGAKAFSEELEERCGCVLAWHKLRRRFMVAREQPIKTYMDLDPRRHGALSSYLIPLIMVVVRTADAYYSMDPGESVRRYFAQQKEAKKRDIKGWVDDRFPEVKSMAEWSYRKMLDPRSRPVLT